MLFSKYTWMIYITVFVVFGLFLSGCDVQQITIPSSQMEITLTPSITISKTITPTPILPSELQPEETFTATLPVMTLTFENNLVISNTAVISACEQVPSPIILDTSDEPNVYLSADIYLCDYSNMNAIDLDNAIIGDYSILTPETNLLGSDIFLRWGTAAPEVWEAWVTEIEEQNSRILPVVVDDAQQLTLNVCKKLLQENLYGGVASFFAGEYSYQFEVVDKFSCILTDEGRIGMMQIDEVNPLGSLSIKIHYVLWHP